MNPDAARLSNCGVRVLFAAMFRRTFIMLFVLAAVARASVELRLDGDRLWMKAQGATMREVMEAFVHAGVVVRYDETITAQCSGTLTNAPLDKSLAQLFGDFGYVFTYNLVSGPVGSFTRLSEIQVFQHGKKEAAKPFGNPNRLAVTRLPGHPQFVSDEFLIGFKPGTNMDHVRNILAQVGGTIVSSIPKIGVYRIRLPPGANVLSIIELLKKNEVVAAIEPNYVTQLPAEKSKADAQTSAMRKLGLPANGAATVAVLDSGQLSGNGYDSTVVGTFNAIQPGSAMSDSVGHGTQMSMIVGGSVAPGGGGTDTASVPVLAIRAFDEAGLTSNYALMDAIDYAAKNGAKVINLSWGTETSSAFVQSSIVDAQNNGMLVVAAAGNEPTGRAVYPSAYPGVVSVAALNADGTLWESSNYGSSVTVAAPGTANFPVGHSGPPGSYAGTSIASAYVSRALAQYLTQNPNASAQQAINALTSSVTDTGTPGRDNYYGYGSLDAAAMSRLLGR